MNPTRTHTRVFASSLALLWMSLGSACAQTQWQVLWEDEFDGVDVDPNNWEHMIGDGTQYGLPSGWGNNELQYYTNRVQNAYVTDGKLHIVAREERYRGFDYTSARLRTKNRHEFQYGRIEARMKLPGGQGIWPAFWMLPTDSPYGGWASSGEIDIMESVNEPLEVHGTIHHWGAWPDNRHTGGEFVPGVDLSEDFHTYAIEWEPDRITWLFDGQSYFSVTSQQWGSEGGAGNPRAPFDHPFHLLLNIAVGGNWPGAPDDTTQFPQTLEVDWVRVSLPEQTPYGGEPRSIPGTIEAEDFDEGWGSIAYNDTDAGNAGGAYRPESDVDIELCSEGGFNVGYIREGEWIEYTVRVDRPGTFRPSVRVASQQAGRFALALNGEELTGELAAPNTGGWQNWTTVAAAPVWLPRGEHVLRFENRGGDAEQFNFNWIRFDRVRPGLRQAEPN